MQSNAENRTRRLPTAIEARWQPKKLPMNERVWPNVDQDYSDAQTARTPQVAHWDDRVKLRGYPLNSFGAGKENTNSIFCADSSGS